MTGIMLAACMMAASPAPTTANAAVPASQRTLQEWRDAVQQAMKAQSSAKEIEQPAAVMALVQLYRDLGAAGPLNSGDDKRLRLIVRARLLRLREEASQDVRQRVARVESVEKKAAREKQPELLNNVNADRAVLAQWKGVLAQFRGVAQVQQAPVAGGDGAANRADDGQELADLIQAVITPDFWDTNGGPGAIVYFQSQHALVVRATTQTHEEVGALLEALRRAH